MALLQWNSSLVTGHVIIDSQHKTLVHLLNTLHKAIDDGVDQSRLLRMFRQFFRYLTLHFNDEEYYTIIIDFNMWHKNRCAHIELINSLTIIMNKINSGEIQVDFSTLKFVSDLYLEHISMSDMTIVACLNKHSTPGNVQNQDTL